MAGLAQGLWENISSKLNVCPPDSNALRNSMQPYSLHLQPLKTCCPAIVDEFAKLSHATRLLYVADKVEKNKRIQLTQFMSCSYATGGALRDSGYADPSDTKWAHVEACFPFDPYQLPVSKRWLALQDNYISWSPIAVLNRPDDNDDNDSEEEEADQSEDDSLGVPESLASDDEDDDDR